MYSTGGHVLPTNRHRNSNEGYALIGNCSYIAPFSQGELPPPHQSNSTLTPYYTQTEQPLRSSKSLNTSRDYTPDSRPISIVSSNFNSVGSTDLDKRCNHNFSTATPNLHFDKTVDTEMKSKGSSKKPMPHLLTVEFNTENINRVTYFVMSCLVTTFINPLFGLIAILLSLKSHNLLTLRTQEGREKARFYGRLAFCVNVLGILITMLSLIIVFIHIGDTEEFLEDNINSDASSAPNSIEKFSTTKPKTIRNK